jgi:hypothetical protein
LTIASTAVVQAKVEASASAVFPSGRWEVYKVSVARTIF